MELELEQELAIKTNPITDDYEVLWNSKLGCGITGAVRQCRLKHTDKKYALKCLLDGPRARQEVALHHKCHGHENILKLYAVYSNNMKFPREDVSKTRLLLVIELMEGGELFDSIKSLKHFSEDMVVNLTTQICHAIEHCHHLNVAHRDLKPENLLLTRKLPDATVKLTDFGFAKLDEGNLTTPNFTPYFAAPQVIRALKNRKPKSSCFHPTSSPICYDKSCDMWSLGVIVYILLCGYPPFYPENDSTALTRRMKAKILAGDYKFHKEDWKMVSSEAKDFIARLLLVDPTARMTADQALKHPWLLSKQHPSYSLLSPLSLSGIILNRFNEAHEQHLHTMRSSDLPLRLKPLDKIRNPILNKRIAQEKSFKSSGNNNADDTENNNNNNK